MTSVCRRCLAPFVRSENHARACQHHPGLFVCRYHPNCASGSGDGLGYYGAGEVNDGWPAIFWDCCGSEEEAAAGCTFQQHTSYDDSEDEP
mmetsp:Transcript_13849/g.41151  ORF Transcript_13849/g.41151 Transcript_13849/m.41151 type:complete len:91 (+) Transcript_13849:387-659(+)